MQLIMQIWAQVFLAPIIYGNGKGRQTTETHLYKRNLYQSIYAQLFEETAAWMAQNKVFVVGDSIAVLICKARNYFYTND